MTPYWDIYTPQAVFCLFVLAFLVDYWSVGTDSIRDRLAFFMSLAAIRVGFDGTPVDQYTTQLALGGLDSLKNVGNTYLARGAADDLLSVAISLLCVFVVGVIIPSKASKKLGRFATLKFHRGSSSRINYTLWICAFLLGTMIELARGPFGLFAMAAVDFDVRLVSIIPGWFGA